MIDDKIRVLCDAHAAACDENKRLRSEIRKLRYLAIKMLTPSNTGEQAPEGDES